MVKIISFFINFLNTLRKLLYKFECFLLKFLPNDSNASSTSDAYRRFKVNALPVIEPEHIPISFQQATEAYEHKHHRTLVPVFRKKGKVYPNKDSICPHCGATHEYLSFNNGEKRTQIRCKVCEHTFSTIKTYSQQVVRKCPHCGNKLSLIRSRSDFDVYKCMNRNCPHFKQELRKLSSEDMKRYKQEPYSFSLHYITRVFNASLEALESIQRTIIPSKVDLSRIRNSKHVLGLVLTYYVNYGLSLRKLLSYFMKYMTSRYRIKQLPITHKQLDIFFLLG